MIPLGAFKAIAELGREQNFTRVAERLGISQPAVSQHVQTLRTHFGVELVDLVGRRAVLTDAGRFLADRAVPILGALDALERDMRELAAAKRGVLRIGASETVGNYALADVLAAYAADKPSVTLEVELGNTSTMLKRLRDGALTLAMVEGDVAGDDLAVEPFADDELVLVVPPAHRLARAPVSAGSLAGETFVAREVGSGTRSLFEQSLRVAGVEPRIALELPTGEVIVRAVAAGMGIAVLSRRVVEDAAVRGRVVIRRIEGIAIERKFRVVWLAERTRSPAANAFVERLTSAYANLSRS
jgi:DNA-binding transcriptional LysR family regulator